MSTEFGWRGRVEFSEADHPYPPPPESHQPQDQMLTCHPDFLDLLDLIGNAAAKELLRRGIDPSMMLPEAPIDKSVEQDNDSIPPQLAFEVLSRALLGLSLTVLYQRLHRESQESLSSFSPPSAVELGHADQFAGGGENPIASSPGGAL